MLIGAKFDMDYETWLCRLHACDREYFAGPLNERGEAHLSEKRSTGEADRGVYCRT